MVKNVRTLAWNDVDETLLRQCAELWARVWPHGLDLSPEGLDANAETRLAHMRERYGALSNHQFHIGLTEGSVVSVARTFTHTVLIIDESGSSTPQRILALASVCSDPRHRGEGWGYLVTEAALARTDAEKLTALFQSGVPEFYERFGSRTIPNEVFTSKPGATAFTDDVVMIHPGSADWNDDARIDLQTSGW